MRRLGLKVHKKNQGLERVEAGLAPLICKMKS